MLKYLGREGDEMLPASSDAPMITAHAVRRHDGTIAVLLVNRDPAATYTVHLRAKDGKALSEHATVYSYGTQSAEIDSSAAPDPTSVTAPPYSIVTVASQ
jgi:hypothetical protein